MHKITVLFVLAHILIISGYSQGKYILSGLVVDENNQALPGASVQLSSGKGTVTNSEGKYVINDLDNGIYEIKVSYIGYKTHLDTIVIDGNKAYRIKMLYSPLDLQEVVVTDNYVETRKKEESLNIEIANKRYLQQNLGGSLMKTIERLPGVSTIDIGSGQSKPVIRGLGFNRIVVVENGIKHEGQQWGADHGLEIDQFAIDKLEVIKGPSSLIHGSDALGGVINVKQNSVPINNSVGGTIDLIGKTNNNLIGTSFSVYGRKNWLFADLRVTMLDYGDYKVPTDSIDIYSYKAAIHNNQLRNTAGEEKNLHFTIGIIQDDFQSKFFISNVYSKNGFFANAHGLEPRNVDTDVHDKSNRDILFPYHEVNHFKVINQSLWEMGKFRFKSDLGFQRNFRQEWSEYVSHGYMPPVFPDNLKFNADIERQFDKHIYNGNLLIRYTHNEKTAFTFGLNGSYQDNDINGRGFIIPAFEQLNMGVFLLAKYEINPINVLQLGIRYDHGKIKTESYNDWFQSPVLIGSDTTLAHLQRAYGLNRNYSNISWSVGYNYNQEKLSFKTNIGRSFRIPIAKELAANGVNYHNFSYEVGDPDLSPEISYQLDLGLEYHLKKFAVGATPFVNYFTNYIYLNPSSEFDRLYGNGNQVFYYTQSEVFRYGGELHAHYQLLKSIKLGVIGEYVYSEQVSGEKKGFTLPFSPPASAIFNIKYQKQHLGFLKNVYLSVDYRITASQTNIVPPEETTDGYQLINISLGGEISLKKQNLSISAQVQNLFNTKHFSHTSYYRLINVPEPGRNFVLNVSIPFSGKIN